MSIRLPELDYLPIEKLNQIFKNTTTSYKFYWFLAILDYVKENDKLTVSFADLFSRMIAFAWYPINHYKINFGHQDQIYKIIEYLNQNEAKLKPDMKYKVVVDQISDIYKDSSAKSEQSRKEIFQLDRYVICRFISPFFDIKNISDKQIIILAEKNFNIKKKQPIYRIDKEKKEIIIQPQWIGYIKRFNTILQDFTLWHLLEYLQKRNPYVPNLANKLFRPIARDLKKARIFWLNALSRIENPRCIYSNTGLSKDFSIDHFLPWSFVTHDLIWNTIPTHKNINSMKSDDLPLLKTYLTPFMAMQYDAINIISKLDDKKILEDYIIGFDNITYSDLESMSKEKFFERISRLIIPQYEIARNMGFCENWLYV